MGEEEREERQNEGLRREKKRKVEKQIETGERERERKRYIDRERNR